MRPSTADRPLSRQGRGLFKYQEISEKNRSLSCLLVREGRHAAGPLDASKGRAPRICCSPAGSLVPIEDQRETPSLSLRLRSVRRFCGHANGTRTRSNRVQLCSTRVRSSFDHQENSKVAL